MKLPLIVAGALAVAAAIAAFVLLDDDGPTEVEIGAPPEGTAPGAAEAGEIRFVRVAATEFEDELASATPEDMAFMREHYWGMRGFPPFSDEAVAWAPPMQFYKDLYALYPSVPAEQETIEQHPDWVLRDAAGNQLYVPFACAGGTCPAYAADPGSEGWQASWIAAARRELEKGYAGVFIDNVNMRLAVGNGAGEEVAPVDPRTGQEMTLADWQRYVAEFMERIRRELPEAEITHNAVWFADYSPEVERQILAADLLELERGFSDPGIVGGDPATYESFLDHVERVHSLGRSVLLEAYDLNDQSRLFELANYFLVNDGGDAIASDYESDPANWWPGWDTALGAPLGPYARSGGILRRDFENGLVIVNPPGAPERKVELPGTYVDLEGTTADSVTLGPAQGAVLRAPE